MMTEHLFESAVSAYRNYHGGYFKTLISPEATQGAMALLEMVLPKGAEPPLHTHVLEDEAFFVQEGEMEFQIGDQVSLLKAGDAIFAPRQVPHLFTIISPEIRFLTVLTPGNFWNYFMEFSTPTTGMPVVEPPQGPPTPELLQLLGERLASVYQVSFPNG